MIADLNAEMHKEIKNCRKMPDSNVMTVCVNSKHH
jgi:hypothetical protein